MVLLFDLIHHILRKYISGPVYLEILFRFAIAFITFQNVLILFLISLLFHFVEVKNSCSANNLVRRFSKYSTMIMIRECDVLNVCRLILTIENLSTVFIV